MHLRSMCPQLALAVLGCWYGTTRLGGGQVQTKKLHVARRRAAASRAGPDEDHIAAAGISLGKAENTLLLS